MIAGPPVIEEAMSRLLHRHRRLLTSTVLGLWVFALFVGIANACSWDGVTAVSHQPTVAAHAIDGALDHDMTPCCDDFCSNDLPLQSVVKLVQDQPAGQPLAFATHPHPGVLRIFVLAPRLARCAYPPPDVSFSLGIARLTL